MNYDKIQLSPIERTIVGLAGIMYDAEINVLIEKNELRDILSSGQLASKSWLLQQIKKIKGIKKILVCGGWFGVLARLIIEDNQELEVHSLDIDPRCHLVASKLLSNGGKSILADMNTFDYNNYDLVINTSLEHLDLSITWLNRLPQNTLCLVQSNNAINIKGHTNCHHSLEHLKQDLKFSQILFTDELVFPMYTRYMIIGIK